MAESVKFCSKCGAECVVEKSIGLCFCSECGAEFELAKNENERAGAILQSFVNSSGVAVAKDLSLSPRAQEEYSAICAQKDYVDKAYDSWKRIEALQECLDPLPIPRTVGKALPITMAILCPFFFILGIVLMSVGGEAGLSFGVLFFMGHIPTFVIAVLFGTMARYSEPEKKRIMEENARRDSIRIGNQQKIVELKQEVANLMQSARSVPNGLDWKYLKPYALYMIVDYFNHGRVESKKEALNLFVKEDRDIAHYEEMEKQAQISAENSEMAAVAAMKAQSAATTAAVFSILSWL